MLAARAGRQAVAEAAAGSTASYRHVEMRRRKEMGEMKKKGNHACLPYLKYQMLILAY